MPYNETSRRPSRVRLFIPALITSCLQGGNAPCLSWDSQVGHLPGPTLPSASQPDSLTEQVRTLWQLRQEAHGEGRLLSYWRRDGLEMRAAFRAWRTAARLQAHNRLLRKACRLVEAVQSDNIYQAARRLKTPKRRIQLRREDGGLQTHEMEFHQIVPWGTGTITHAH